MLLIREHKSASYAPRTYANAHDADITIALAVDYNTAGEKLTHKAAIGKYLALPLENCWIENARTLYTFMRERQARTINVAGNGIYTLNKHGWDQDQINVQVHLMLEIVHKHHLIHKVISGGQTGVDIAGGYAGWKLGIDTVLTLPKGFKQRHEDGVDVEHTEGEIRNQIIL